MTCCFRCGEPVSADEIALNRKLISRGVQSFLCIPCLALEFGCTEERLREKIQEYKHIGCLLFMTSTPQDT